jgi:hypothetical protein
MHNSPKQQDGYVSLLSHTQLIFSPILQFCSQDLLVTSPLLPLRRETVYKNRVGDLPFGNQPGQVSGKAEREEEILRGK